MIYFREKCEIVLFSFTVVVFVLEKYVRNGYSECVSERKSDVIMYCITESNAATSWIFKFASFFLLTVVLSGSCNVIRQYNVWVIRVFFSESKNFVVF